jgi:hypothetical protein
MNILHHPAYFCKNLTHEQKRDALNEYKLIRNSNALSPLAAWFRQTKYKDVKVELEKFFERGF